MENKVNDLIRQLTEEVMSNQTFNQSVESSRASLEDKQRQAVKNSAVKYLSKREYGANELIQKLTKFYDEDLAALVVDDLRQRDWQSDQRFANMWVRSRANRGYGPSRIVYELKQKGVSADEISIAVNAQAYEKSWFDLAREVYTKKYGLTGAESWKEKAKRLNFMQHKGFNRAHIAAIFDEH